MPIRLIITDKNDKRKQLILEASGIEIDTSTNQLKVVLKNDYRLQTFQMSTEKEYHIDSFSKK